MVKIAWKTIKGYGPYAYLQQSVKLKDGKVISQHLAYLGKLGSNSLVPGHHVSVSLTGERPNLQVLVPHVPPALKKELKPSSTQLVESIEAQVEAGIPVKQIGTKPSARRKPSKKSPKDTGRDPFGVGATHAQFASDFGPRYNRKKYEWNNAKRQKNLQQHGLDFADVELAFDWDKAVIRSSPRRGEMRYKATSYMDNKLRTIVFAMRGDAFRIISLRPASGNERREYG